MVLVNDILQLYTKNGFVGPLKAFEAHELDGVAEAALREMEAGKFSLLCKRNRHLDWDVARLLTSPPAIIEVARDVLGPDLVLWRTNFFLGFPGVGVRWHQDQYNGLIADPLHQISIHLGVTDAPSDNCVMVVPGSHHMSRDELACSGFNFIAGTDEDGYGAPNYWRTVEGNVEIVKLALRAGEFFAFHPNLVHGSVDETLPPDAERRSSGLAQRLWSRVTRGRPRVGFALRVTVPENHVYPAAFTEALPRVDHCVPIETSTPLVG